MTSPRTGWLAIALVAASLVLLAQQRILDTPPAEPPPEMTSRPTPPVHAHVLPVARAADVSKPGELRSFMGQWVLAQDARTSGPSPDSLRFTFDAPAHIVGIVVSVDISGMPLVEVVAGINTPAPYGIVEPGSTVHRDFVARDWLLHTSNANDGGPTHIDEQAWFPAGGFAVEPGDYVAIEAWLGNTAMQQRGVSPEVIVFYTWDE